VTDDGDNQRGEDPPRIRRSRGRRAVEEREKVAKLPLVPRAPAPPPPPLEIQHRRRRAVALAALALASLLVGAASGAGSGGSPGAARPAAVRAVGYFSRIDALAGKGRGSLGQIEARAENQAITRTLAYTPYVREAGAQHREIALTFDDGPGPYTPDIVRVLSKMHTPATFFEVGIEEQYFHDGTSEIVQNGWPIGDHTENHYPMSQLSEKAQQQQLLHEAAAIGDYGAPFPRMFRPPYGLWNATTLKLLKHYRMLMILWTVDTSDYTLPGTDAIVQRALQGAKPGAIILMHDAGGDRSETVAAVPQIIRGLRARGYRLVTVPRLLLDNPAPHNQSLAGLGREGG
jgi:peptidoglycan-N-acetylglucosamine deacetylase